MLNGLSRPRKLRTEAGPAGALGVEQGGRGGGVLHHTEGVIVIIISCSSSYLGQQGRVGSLAWLPAVRPICDNLSPWWSRVVGSFSFLPEKIPHGLPLGLSDERDACGRYELHCHSWSSRQFSLYQVGNNKIVSVVDVKVNGCLINAA